MGALALSLDGAVRRRDAVVLDADFATGRYRFDGKTHDNEAAFLTAAGGTRLSSVLSFGPYIKPGSPDLVSNGSFAAGLSGWSSVLNGVSSVSVVTGLARLSSDGAGGTGGGGAGILQAVPTEAGQAYVLEFTRSGSAGTLRVGSTSLGVDLATVGIVAAGQNGVPFGSRGSAAHVYLFRSTSGVTDIDDVRVRAARPVKGFAQGGCLISIEGVTPAAAGGEKCLLSMHNLASHDVISMFWDAAGMMRVRVLASSVVQADLNLGAVAPNTSFSVRAGLSENRFVAQLNGGVVREDTSGVMPGVACMRIGESPVPNTTWDGSITRIRIERGFSLSRFYAPVSAVVAIGDSFMGGAQGVVLPATLQNLLARTVINAGVGGSDMAAILARLRDPANAYMRDKTLILWDGDENGFVDLASYCDLVGEIVAALGHQRFLLIPPCVNQGQADWSVQNSIRDAFLARWPSHVIDWRDHLAISGGLLDASMFTNLPSDATHLSQTAMSAMTNALATALASRGW